MREMQEKLFSKPEMEELIATLSKLSYAFRDSSALKATGGGRNQKMKETLHSYAGILGYYYEEIYHYGKFQDIVDQEIGMRYVLVMLAMGNEAHRKATIISLSDNWNDILRTIAILQMSTSPEQHIFIGMQSEINKVTQAFEKMSNSNNIKEMKDRYSEMVESSTFNPFNITTNPMLQNAIPLPDGMEPIFKQELMRIYSSPVARQHLGNMQILTGYVFNMVESYYKNAGYVPKNTVDAIIELCYHAVSTTAYGAFLESLDGVKYHVYYSLLNN